MRLSTPIGIVLPVTHTANPVTVTHGKPQVTSPSALATHLVQLFSGPHRLEQLRRNCVVENYNNKPRAKEIAGITTGTPAHTQIKEWPEKELKSQRSVLNGALLKNNRRSS